MLELYFGEGGRGVVISRSRGGRDMGGVGIYS